MPAHTHATSPPDARPAPLPAHSPRNEGPRWTPPTTTGYAPRRRSTCQGRTTSTAPRTREAARSPWCRHGTAGRWPTWPTWPTWERPRWTWPSPAARRAFDSGPWPRLAPVEHGRVLLRVADLIEAERADLALTVSLEMGKPITDAYDIELRALTNTFRWYGQLADKLTDESPHTAPDALALVTREPAGVVGAVVPWNFPLTLAGWKVAPALAAGSTVVLKPAENAPLSALRLARVASVAGLPPGILNVVSGSGPVAGRALGLHPDVDVLAFTGSTAVGRHFLRYAADSNLKRVWLELGGKSPNIILPDAPDLEQAAATAAWGIFFNQGEMCTAPSRLLVHSSVAERVTEAVVDRARALRVGDPLDPATAMGPLVSGDHLHRVLGHVHAAIDTGARLRTGGERVLTQTGGLPPTHRLRPRGPGLGTGARRGLRARPLRLHLRRPRRGRGPRQRHRLRTGRRRVDRRPVHGPPGLARPARRHRLGQLLRGGRPHRALRRHEAVR